MERRRNQERSETDSQTNAPKRLTGVRPIFGKLTVQSLRDSLNEWQDVDLAMYYLAVALGLLDDPKPFGGRKDLFWTNNSVGKVLFEQLNLLASIGILESDDNDRFRWRHDFSLPK